MYGLCERRGEESRCWATFRAALTLALPTAVRLSLLAMSLLSCRCVVAQRIRDAKILAEALQALVDREERSAMWRG